MFAYSEITHATDNISPELIGFDFTPKVVNVSDSAQEITFTARITDNLSGVGDDTQVRFRSPSGNQEIMIYFWPTTLVSGSLTNGIFEQTVSMPRYSEAGTWTVSDAALRDEADNMNWMGGSEAIAYCTNRDFPFKLSVIDTFHAVANIATPDDLQISWNSISNVYYIVEYLADLRLDQWQGIGGKMHADCDSLVVTNDISSTPKTGFYRIRVLPPQ